MKLALINSKLRQHLEEAQGTSSRLMEDVQQLSTRWEEAQRRLHEKEEQWRESMEVRGREPANYCTGVGHDGMS